jgi:hypothetical protein
VLVYDARLASGQVLVAPRGQRSRSLALRDGRRSPGWKRTSRQRRCRDKSRGPVAVSSRRVQRDTRPFPGRSNRMSYAQRHDQWLVTGPPEVEESFGIARPRHGSFSFRGAGEGNLVSPHSHQKARVDFHLSPERRNLRKSLERGLESNPLKTRSRIRERHPHQTLAPNAQVRSRLTTHSQKKRTILTLSENNAGRIP